MPEKQKSVLSIDKARAFFNSQPTTQTKSEQRRVTPSIFEPDWTTAEYQFPHNRAEVVNVDIFSQNVIVAKIGDKIVDAQQELRIMDGEKFTTTRTFIATYIPLQGCVLTDQMKAQAVKGRSRTDKFTGIVLVHNLQGFFFSAERYVEGELISYLVIADGDGAQDEIDNILATKFLNGIQLYSVHRHTQATKSGNDVCPYCGTDYCGYSGTGNYGGGNPGSCGNPLDMGSVTVRPAPKMEYTESGYDWENAYPWSDPYGYYGGTGDGGSGNPGTPWPGYIHNMIINSALSGLTPSQRDLVKDGSNNADADMYQKVPYNHMHAMREPGETVAQAIDKMRNYFVGQVTQYKNTGNYFYLGMALHPIMDAYASPHSGFQIFDGSRLGWAEHLSELTISADNYEKYYDSITGIRNIYNLIDNLPSNFSEASINALFYEWLSGYTY